MSKGKDEKLIKLGKTETCTFEEFQFYIQNMREHLGMSREELARFLVVSPQTIQNWEKGKKIPKDPYTVYNAIRHLLHKKKVEKNEQKYRK